MTLEKQPKSLVVVGSGAIGVEFAYFYNSIGTDVNIVEFCQTLFQMKMRMFQRHLKSSRNKE